MRACFFTGSGDRNSKEKSSNRGDWMSRFSKPLSQRSIISACQPPLEP
jgi:hypothetical protein